jgi:hypothetical protein
MDAARAWWQAILRLESALFQRLTKLNLMSWRSCENRNRKCRSYAVLKSHSAENESYATVFPFGVWRCLKQSALQKPEFLNIMPSSRRSSAQGAFGLMFLYSSLNSPNDPVAGVAFLFGPSGTAAICCGKELSGRQSNNLFLRPKFAGGDFNLKLKRKELHL